MTIPKQDERTPGPTTFAGASPNLAEQQFVVINGPEAGCVSVVTGIDALVAEVKSLLWDGDDPPDDVLRILDVVGDLDAHEWHEHSGGPPHLHYRFEDGWIAVWIVTGNAYGSTDALRSALEECIDDILATAVFDGIPKFETERNPVIVRARAALSASPAPDNDLANRVRAHVERLANTVMQLPLDEWSGISNDILRCADVVASGSPAPSTEGLREAPCDCSQEDVHDYGPCGESCRALAVTDEWRAFHSLVQPNVWGIECGDETIIPPSLSERTAKFVAGKYNDRTALAGVTAPSEVDAK